MLYLFYSISSLNGKGRWENAHVVAEKHHYEQEYREAFIHLILPFELSLSTISECTVV